MDSILKAPGLRHLLAKLKERMDTAAPRPNLLDNWYFTDPINQRGVSGTVSDTGYFIDRWKLVSGTVQLTASGLVLNGSIAQILETDPGGTVTATALTTGGPVAAAYSAAAKTFTITSAGGTILAAKLELGAQQTLVRQDRGAWVLRDAPPDRALELAKCQRYQMVLTDGSVADEFSFTGIGVAYTEHNALILIPIPQNFRTVKNVEHRGTFYLFGDSRQQIPTTSLKMDRRSKAYVDIIIETDHSLTVGETMLLRTMSEQDSFLMLDANL